MPSPFISGGVAVAPRWYNTDKANLNADGSKVVRSYRVYSVSRGVEIDENTVAGSIALATPLLRGTLIRRDISLERQNAYGWIATVTWETFRPRDQDEPGYEEIIRGSTSGGTVPVTWAMNHVNSYDKDGVVTDEAKMHAGALNVKRVAGQPNEMTPVEIGVRQLDFVVERTFPPGTVTQSYINTLYNLTYTVNDATFRGAASGEMLFLGADFNLSNLERETVSYSFSASPNVTNFKIGQYKLADKTYTITCTKEGHEYVWVENEDSVETAGDGSKRRIARPKLAHVEQLYEKSDFNLLGI